MGKRTVYFCDICGKETLRDDEFYDIQFTQPGEPLGAGLGQEVCETCYKKMFDHLTKISNIGKEEKKEEDISCSTCRHLLNTDTEVYCIMNHTIVGGLGNTCCSEWKSKTHSHENPTT